MKRLLVLSWAVAAGGGAWASADPLAPVIPGNSFLVGAATGNATTDTASLAAAIANAKAAGGGTVEVPAGTYVSNTLTLSSGINLHLDAGAIIRDATSATLITASGSNLHDIEISGSGMIDGHATAVSSSNLIDIRNINKLMVTGVTIANSSHFHLVVSNDNNLTIDGVHINDDFTVAQTAAYLANTDGIDFSGQHIAIRNSSVSAGDDDIVAKPGSTFVGDVLISDNTIGAGHGISIGGQTNSGLNGMTVQRITFNGTTNGLRMKAGTGMGGVVKNVSFSNITMTNVANPIIINSWYDGGDHYGSKELSPSSLHNAAMFNVANPGDPAVVVDELNNVALDPFYENISYNSITATGASGNVAIIYGLNSSPAQTGEALRNIDGISFANVSLSGAFGADIYYASNLDLSGLSVTAGSGNKENLFGDTFVAVPEPRGVGILAGMAVGVLGRRRRSLVVRGAL